MGETPQFVIRPLVRNTPSLDGAFRVAINPPTLDLLGLRPGDLCHLTGPSGVVGTGIACRSTDAKPISKMGPQPLKLSDTFREAFDLTLGDVVSVEKSRLPISHADKVVVTDISESTPDTARSRVGRYTCGSVLENAEAIASGVIFQSTTRGRKRQYLIESVEAKVSIDHSLYFYDDDTQLVINTQGIAPRVELASSTASLVLSGDGVGGLDVPIETINESLAALLAGSKGGRHPADLHDNAGILILGSNGTGKSLLADRLADLAWTQVYHLNQSMMTGLSSAKIQMLVSSIVDQALKHQPSLILMDDIHRIAPTDAETTNYAPKDLVKELARVQDTRVMVVATATSLAEVNKDLRASLIFEIQLELPVPDQDARVQILGEIHKTVGDGNEAFAQIATHFGGITHGYVGRDLLHLYRKGYRIARRRRLGATSQASSTDSADKAVKEADEALLGPARTSESADQSTDLNSLMEGFVHAMATIQPTAMHEIFLEKPNVQWSQIGGSDSIRHELHVAIDWPLKHRAEMEEYKTEPRKGILLYGPPGCSKTMTAQACAAESGLNFLAVKGAELTSMYVGESERAVREIFRKARNAAPSILFIDEIDSIASARERGGNSGLNVLTTLLNEMDGFEQMRDVFVLAATNTPEILDPALLRPGRFDQLIYMGPPGDAARREILRIRTSGRPAKELDLDELVQATEGFSGAEVVSICQRTVDRALGRRIARKTAAARSSAVSVNMDEGWDKVSMDDFRIVLAEAVRGITPESVAAYEAWRAGARR